MSLNGRKSLEPWLYDSVEFYPHQIEGVRWCARHRSFILGDDMGLGKSLQALATFAIDVVRDYAKTAIVVAPVTLKENWVDEVEKWTSFPYLVLEGAPAERKECLQEFRGIQGPKILITNYEQAIRHTQDYNALGFDVAIFDEAHYMKNPRAKRTKACMQIRSMRSFLLSGTPMLNQVNELWALLHRIDPVTWRSYWGFVNRYCVMGGWKNKQIVGIKNEAELLERLHAIMIRRLKKDVLDLPEVQYIQRRVALAPEQREIYDKIRADLRSPFPTMTEMDIQNGLVEFLRLKQVCGSTFSFTGEDISAKLDLIIEDAIELIMNGQKIVFFTQFRDILELYQRRLRDALPQLPIFEVHGNIPQDQRVPIVKQWGQVIGPAVLGCMLQVAQHGLNMTAARYAQFGDKLFVPGLNQQAVDRLHRIGSSTTQPVTILEYICKSTIENRVETINRTKKVLFANVIETSDWKRQLYQAVMEEDDDE